MHFHQYVKDRGEVPVHEPDDPLRNPYTHRHGQDGVPVWAIMAQFPDRLKAFQLGLASQEDSVPIIGFYDFSSLYDPEDDGDRATLIDLGGGQGQSIMQILKAFPTLKPERMILQDLPEPIQQAQTSKLLPDGVQAMVHDFWTPQPIKGAKAYFFRRIGTTIRMSTAPRFYHRSVTQWLPIQRCSLPTWSCPSVCLKLICQLLRWTTV